MQVSCPGCQKSYQVDETQLPETGRKMRCPKCKEVFRVTRPKAPASPPVPPPSPAAPPASPPKAEDDFSDIHIPSIPPEGGIELDSLPPAPPRSPESDLAGPEPERPMVGEEEFDLDTDLAEPSLPPLPRLSDTPDSNELDFGSITPPDSTPPASTADAEAYRRDTVDLPSMSAPTPALELDTDDDMDFDRGSVPSLPAALGLPEDSGSRFTSHADDDGTPALQNLPEVDLEEDGFDEIDFGPTVEKSATLSLDDDDAEFDFTGAVSSAPTPPAPTEGEFGDIELVDIPSEAPPRPAPPPPPEKRPVPPSPAEDSTADDSFEPEPPASSLPPLGVSLDSYEAPIEGMPSPADLLAAANEPPPPRAPRTTTADAPLPPPTRSQGTGTMDYGEVDLSPGDGASIPDIDADEFDGFPTETGPSARPQNDLDLVADPMSLRMEAVEIPEEEDHTAAAGDGHRRASFDGRRRYERQSRRVRFLLLTLLVVIVGIGGGLSFTSYGPFGANVLFRLIPKPVNEEAVARTLKSARKKLQSDIPKSWQEAIKETKAAYTEYPSSDELRYFLTFLYYMQQIRFGADTKLDAAATELLGITGFGEAESTTAATAQAAQYLRFARPMPKKPQLTAALKKSAEGQVLLTELALSRGKPGAALPIAQALDTAESSPRSGYLLARVFLETGDPKRAAEAASRLKKVIAARPDHLDAALAVPAALLSTAQPNVEKVRTALDDAASALKKYPPATKAHKGALHGLRARLAVFERNYPVAEKEIALAEKSDPENLSMLLAKGTVLSVRRDYPGAAAAFAKALAADPDNTDGALGKIETALREGELEKAAKALDKLMPKVKKNARAHYLMGEIRSALKETDTAEKELKRAVELDETLLEAYVSLSTLYRSLKRNDEAMRILDQASETVPGSPLIKKTLAAGHAARGDWASAVVELDNALKIDPDDTESHFEMAVMYRKMGSFDDAKRALAEVEKRDPAYPGLALEQGLLMEQTGDTASALSAYKKALAGSPQNNSLKLRVGAASYLLGDLETAEKLLKEVVDAQPTLPEANFYYGETLRAAHRAPEGLRYLTKATEAVPDNPVYHLRLGMAYAEMRDTERAMKSFQTTVSLDPKNAEAYVEMGQIQLRRGAVRDAVENLQYGLSLDPTLSDGYLAAAQAYEQLSQNSAARKYYRKAAEVEPDNAEVHYRLGLAELQVNGKGASLSGFTRAVDLADKATPKPDWFFEALYRRGVAERARGMRAQAVASFKRYLAEAPDSAIDRSEVVANLDDMGILP